MSDLVNRVSAVDLEKLMTKIMKREVELIDITYIARASHGDKTPEVARVPGTEILRDLETITSRIRKFELHVVHIAYRVGGSKELLIYSAEEVRLCSSYSNPPWVCAKRPNGSCYVTNENTCVTRDCICPCP